MYKRSAFALTAPTRRLRQWRRLVHIAPLILLALFGLFVLAARFHPTSQVGSMILAYALMIPMAVLGIAYVATEGAFRTGLFKCPCCGESFTEKNALHFRFLVPAQCEYCGYDIVTMHRKGDF